MKWLKRLFGGGLTYRGTAGSASVDSYQVQIATLYNELLFSVERCFPGESRHQTALRYIREAEARASQSGTCMQNKVIGS